MAQLQSSQSTFELFDVDGSLDVNGTTDYIVVTDMSVG